MSLQAILILGDARHEVTASLHVDSSGGLRSWVGELISPPGVFLWPGMRCRLELPAGFTLDIVLQGGNPLSGRLRFVSTAPRP
jgi:hypothetical protein